MKYYTSLVFNPEIVIDDVIEATSEEVAISIMHAKYSKNEYDREVRDKIEYLELGRPEVIVE